jgi:hypothetical protein
MDGGRQSDGPAVGAGGAHFALEADAIFEAERQFIAGMVKL